MQPAVAETELRDSLAAFETCLEMPLVPGQFEVWLADARSALARVGTILPEHIRRDHRPQIEEIADEDKELFARVETLRSTDRKTLERLNWFYEWGARLADRTALTEPDEGKLEEEFAEFIKQGLEFVIHVRKQELAVTTWLNEALNRENGPGD